MRSIFWGVLFFICFFRISLFSPLANISLLLGMLAVPLLTFRISRQGRFVMNKSIAIMLILVAMLFTFSLVMDIITGEIVRNTTNTFSVRIFTVMVMSVATAAFIDFYYVSKHPDRLRKVITIAFVLQTAAWVATYLSADLKVLLYTLTGQGDSINLESFYIDVRGFGVSTEINYTSPFMMVLLAMTVLKSKLFTLTIVGTQAINSNMSVIISVISLVLSQNVRPLSKVLISLLAVAGAIYLGSQAFPRAYAEFVSGNGLHTINILLSEHVFFLYSNALEFIFGVSVYTFQGGHTLSTDIGWVIIMNYGGLYFVISYFLVMVLTIWHSFPTPTERILWLVAGIILNTKGLLLGPNAFIFTITLMYLRQQRTVTTRNKKSVPRGALMTT